MTEPIIPGRRSGGRRHKRVRIYDTKALMELFVTDDEGVVWPGNSEQFRLETRVHI